jgi:hypothetical protein
MGCRLKISRNSNIIKNSSIFQLNINHDEIRSTQNSYIYHQKKIKFHGSFHSRKIIL